MNEYGNKTACKNCGDEWATLTPAGYCPECQQTYETYETQQPTTNNKKGN